MITVAHLSNPFEPYKSKVLHGCAVRTIEEAKELVTGSKEEFTTATICLVNGNAVMRGEWQKPILKKGDVVGFAAVPGDVISIIIAVVVAVIAAVVVSSLAKVNPPKIPGQIPEPDPVFNLSGQKNQVRLGYPIEAPYGRCHLWPSYAAKVYNQYIDNDQWQFQLFCLGQGSFQIHELRIDDTPLSQFQDVEAVIYEPGEEVTLFPNNVSTSVEVAGIELYGPNEASYSGYVGGYVANTPFTTAFRLECDVVLLNGLYYSNDKGGLDERTVTAEFEYRALDNVGDPIGGWILLFSFSKTLKTVTPQRFTLSATVTPGRYEVRARRTNNKDESQRAGNTLQWETLRAFMEKTDYFGDVTLLAVKARASNNLNNQSSNRFNVTATRKLPRWNGSTWLTPAATRNPVWAFCDVFRSRYGGQLADIYLPLADLKALADDLDELGDCFDWVFDQKTTVWDAAKTIGRACRCTPTLQGSSATLIRDTPKTVPVAVFTPDNISEGSFRWEVKLSSIEEFDGLEVMYQDEDTEKEETLLCLLPGEEGNNPDNIRLPGVTQRQQAYREGMYLRASERYSRENVVFKTGYEGLIPTVGDLIAVSHDVPRWGSSGFVTEIDGLNVTLDTDLTFAEGMTHQLVLRKKDGSAAGPYTVIAGAEPNKLILAGPISESFFFDSEHEPTFFLFGVSNLWSTLCKVSNVAPAEDEEVEITAVVYNSTIYSFDELEAPALEESTIPSAPNLPTVYNLNVASVPNDPTRARATWNPALGAQSYLVQTSTNGINWNSVARVTETEYVFNVTYGVLYVRVAGINLGAGPWATWTGSLGAASVPTAAVTGLALVSPFVGPSLEVSWTASAGAVAYEVKVYQATRTLVKRTSIVSTTSFTYLDTEAAEDTNPRHSLSVGVSPINSAGTRGPEVFVDATNPIPAVLTGFSLLFLNDTGTERNYRVGWTANADTDLAGYRVWVSATSGFTPSDANLVYDGPANTFDLALTLTAGAHAAIYWKVAAYDVWGVADGFSISAQQTFPEISVLKDGSGNTLKDGSGNTLKG